MRTVVRNSYTPDVGDYCNTIVVDKDKGVQYIFDSDGVFSTYTSKQQEGAPMFYVDSSVNAAKNEMKTYTDTKSAQVLAEAKQYTDEHGGTGDVTQAYVDAQDAATLQAAKDYTDSHVTPGSVTQEYVDQHDAATLASAKSYADTQDTATLSAANTAAQAAISSAISAANVPVFTVSNVDIQEGSALPANNFYGVYIDEESE